jgi:hypothetical protein
LQLTHLFDTIWLRILESARKQAENWSFLPGRGGRQMKILKLTLLVMIALGLVFSAAYAVKHLPEERGKTLFEEGR